MIGSIGNGRGLVIVVLVMCAVFLGAYAVQYYIWTAPTRVTKLTSSTTLITNNESGAMHNRSENWGSDPTASAGATAAESLYLPPNEKIGLGFRVRGSDISGITGNFADLDVRINLYIPGENLEVQTYNENCLLKDVVSDGTARDVSGVLDNSTSGFEPGINLDAVIHISENTQDVGENSTVNLPIKIWAEERG